MRLAILLAIGLLLASPACILDSSPEEKQRELQIAEVGFIDLGITTDVVALGNRVLCLSPSVLTVLQFDAGVVERIGSYEVADGSAIDVICSDERAYLLTKSTLSAINIVNPGELVVAATETLAAPGVALALSEGHVLVAEGDRQMGAVNSFPALEVFSVRGESELELVAQCDDHNAWGVLGADDVAYLGWYYGLVVYDISRPATPNRVAEFVTKDDDDFKAIKDFIVCDGSAYLLSYRNLWIVDLLDRAGPVRTLVLSGDDLEAPGELRRGIWGKAPYLFLQQYYWTLRLQVYEIGGSEKKPNWLGTMETRSQEIYDIEIQEDHVFVASSSGLEVYRITQGS